MQRYGAKSVMMMMAVLKTHRCVHSMFSPVETCGPNLNLKAIFLLLQKLSREPQQQKQPPGQKPLRKHLLFLPEFSFSWVKCLPWSDNKY